MTDPSIAMHSFQQMLTAGRIQLQKCRLYTNLYVFADEPAPQKPRMTYVRLDKNTVIAFVTFAICSPIENIPCFQIGYATPEGYRCQGRAKEIVSMAIEEMKSGYKIAGVTTFYIEAIVDADNIPSQMVAEKGISTTRESMIDEISGTPAYRYLLKIE